MQERVDSRILPFYIVCEESASMGPNGGIDALNRGMSSIYEGLCSNLFIIDKCRIGIIAFSDIAEELLPLTNLLDVQAMPGIVAKGKTNYGEAFNLLREVIARDVANLESQGLQIYRPSVFFITCSEPTDDWEASHRALTDIEVNPQAPNIIGYGVAAANPAVIEKIATQGAFIAGKEDSDVYTIVSNWIKNPINYTT